MSITRRKLLFLLTLGLVIAIAGLYVWAHEPWLLNSGIADLQGAVFVEGALSHQQPVALTDAQDHEVIQALAAALSSGLRKSLALHSLAPRASLLLTLHNGNRLHIGCSTEDIVFIEGSTYHVNAKRLRSALDAVLQASLAKLPSGDKIALTGNVVAVDGAVLWPSRKDGFVVNYTIEKDPRGIAELVAALSQRKPSRYNPDAIVADLNLTLRDGTWLFVETYERGQVLIEERSGEMRGYCSQVDPAKLASVYSLWRPKSERVESP